MEERDRWWWCWRKKKKIKKERVGVLAFSAVLQPHRGRFKGVSAFCPAVVKKKKKKNQSQ